MDGGEIFIRNSEFCFASNVLNFVGFGLNFDLVDCFEVIPNAPNPIGFGLNFLKH